MILAVVAVNVVFATVGYAFLGRSRWRLSWAGVALLVGAGAVGTALFFAAIAGVKLSLPIAAVCAAGLAVAGSRFRWDVPEPRPRPLMPLTAAAFGLVAALCVLGLIGGFRSSPWLDDAWGIWLPKGLALWGHGLDERLFVPNGEYVTFGVPEYPLWWSVVTSSAVRATLIDDPDVRAMCAQLALLTVAFIGTVARLLWGHVRSAVLAATLLLLTLSPELWRHVQGGVADLPLAIYLATGVLAGALWLRTRAPFHLALTALGGAVALQIKSEALPEVVALVIVGTLCSRRLALAAVSLVFALPWLAWRWVHDVPTRAELDFGRVDRVPDALRAVGEHAFDPTEWLLIAPLVIALAVAARKPAALLVPAALAAVVVAAYWIDRDEITYVLATSAYRVVDPVLLASAVLVPLLAEAFLQQREPLREDHVLVGEP